MKLVCTKDVNYRGYFPYYTFEEGKIYEGELLTDVNSHEEYYRVHIAKDNYEYYKLSLDIFQTIEEWRETQLNKIL